MANSLSSVDQTPNQAMLYWENPTFSGLSATSFLSQNSVGARQTLYRGCFLQTQIQTDVQLRSRQWINKEGIRINFWEISVLVYVAESAALAKGTTLACIKKKPTKIIKKKKNKIPQNPGQALAIPLCGTATALAITASVNPMSHLLSWALFSCLSCAVQPIFVHFPGVCVVALCPYLFYPMLMEEIGWAVSLLCPYLDVSTEINGRYLVLLLQCRLWAVGSLAALASVQQRTPAGILFSSALLEDGHGRVPGLLLKLMMQHNPNVAREWEIPLMV